MSVISEFQLAAHEFQLGQILSLDNMTTVELEKLVPLGESAVPLFWIHGSRRESFLETVNDRASVNDAREVDVFDDRALFTLDWDVTQDSLVRAITECDGSLITAVGTADNWSFEVRFPDHQSLSDFQTRCDDYGLAVEPTRIYNPTDPDAGPWFGLTDPQREAITLAVEMGYYDIPRSCTTKELADELGISDQAVTERLRRAIAELTRRTQLVQS